MISTNLHKWIRDHRDIQDLVLIRLPEMTQSGQLNKSTECKSN